MYVPSTTHINQHHIPTYLSLSLSVCVCVCMCVCVCVIYLLSLADHVGDLRVQGRRECKESVKISRRVHHFSTDDTPNPPQPNVVRLIFLLPGPRFLVAAAVVVVASSFV